VPRRDKLDFYPPLRLARFGFAAAGLFSPGGNITGFIIQEAASVGKRPELLTEMAPGVKRAAFMFNPDTAPGGGSYFLPSFKAAAQALKLEPIPAPVHSDHFRGTFRTRSRCCARAASGSEGCCGRSGKPII
jgi:hypothetical protein